MAMTFVAPIPWEADAFYAQPGMAAVGLSLDRGPVGTGACMMTEFVQDRRHVMKRNPNYRGEQNWSSMPTTKQQYKKTRKGMKTASRNELTSAQIDFVVQMIAEGLKENEINAMAASFDPPFTVSARHLYSYRKSREKRIKELRQQHEDVAITTGLAIRAQRITKLVKLAERMELDLFSAVDERIWIGDRKAVGQEIVYFEKFNTDQIEAYRKLLDDIAKELGHRS